MSVTGFAPFYLMNNVIQNYAWGSVDSIQQLFGIDNPTQQPQAEIWMGAHPGGCSQITVAGKPQRLADVIQEHRSTLLSATTADQFGELPYLFKVLAAAKALSIQVHPSKAEAEIGFCKENEAQIPFHAANRNYKDPNHKPELVYALTEYHAMNGFRPLQHIVKLFEEIEITGGYKYGEQVDEVDWSEVYDRNVVVSFSDHPNWAYASQITQWLPYKVNTNTDR